MPAWLSSLLGLFGPAVVKWALAFLESKYPGLAAIIQDIINYIDGQPNAPTAISAVQSQLGALTQKKS